MSVGFLRGLSVWCVVPPNGRMKLMKDDVEFIEDKTFLTALPEDKIPENSIEGWFYKKFPGSIAAKRFILLCIVIILFVLSGIFFLLSRSNSIDTSRSIGFVKSIVQL